jgi:hypothetical protein
MRAAHAISSLLLDRLTWATGEIEKDILSRIPDPAARLQVRNRINDPEQFGDIMAELFVWGWFNQSGFEADLGEEEGKPDIAVRPPVDTSAEVKRLRYRTPPRHVRSVLQKANRQIKRARPEGVGIVFVHVERSGSRASLDDRAPSDVQPYIDEAIRELTITVVIPVVLARWS